MKLEASMCFSKRIAMRSVFLFDETYAVWGGWQQEMFGAMSVNMPLTSHR